MSLMSRLHKNSDTLIPLAQVDAIPLDLEGENQLGQEVGCPLDLVAECQSGQAAANRSLRVVDNLLHLVAVNR